MASNQSRIVLEPNITAKGKYECPICGRAFYSKQFYENHLNIDHPER